MPDQITRWEIGELAVTASGETIFATVSPDGKIERRNFENQLLAISKLGLEGWEPCGMMPRQMKVETFEGAETWMTVLNYIEHYKRPLPPQRGSIPA